jgi:hypothetical protein
MKYQSFSIPPPETVEDSAYSQVFARRIIAYPDADFTKTPPNSITGTKSLPLDTDAKLDKLVTAS